jgi:plasmid stabilization system protein ParE
VNRLLFLDAAAEAEIEAIQDQYLAQSWERSSQFMLALSRCFAFITDEPEAFPTIGNGKRRILLKGFPYLLIYQIKDDDVFILRCIHVRSDHRST